MNASLIPRKSRPHLGAWSFDETEEDFDNFVMAPSHKTFRGDALYAAPYSVTQTKWELRIKVKNRANVGVQNKVFNGSNYLISHDSLHKIEDQKIVYPRFLIRWFAIGSCAFLLGVVLLPIMIFFGTGPLDLVVAALMAAGSSLVALTVARGQEIDESGA